ncbi:MAG TPA: hypothetical protein PKK92_08870 [Methanothrix sp.]|nr:hypothetical protein [Methanothrix sp.]
MVRSAITVNALDGAFNNHETADTIDKDNDHTIAGADAYRYLILSFELSAATAEDTITLVAGTAGPAYLRDQGDLVFSAAGGAERACIGPVESGRFLQTDGSISIDVAGTSIAGTIDAYGIE